MRSYFSRVFGLDLRALAALRIASALLLLASLADRLRDFGAFYTDAGVLSNAASLIPARFEPWDGMSSLRPFDWLPDPWGSIALFGGAAAAAALLLVGTHTRWASFLAWVMLTGIDNRNPLVIDAGDDILRLLLFWGLFLPLSARWSMDARHVDPPRAERVFSAGTVAFLVQLCLIYSVSALFKSYRRWVLDGDALYYALHLEQFVTPFGVGVRDYVPTRLLSAGAWWLELAGPWLLFSPIGTDRLRYLLLAGFAAMHLGIDLTLGIGLFSYVCIAAWLVTLPTAFWRRLDIWVSPPRRSAPAPHHLHVESAPRRRLAAELLAAFFLVYVCLWNFWSLSPGTREASLPFGARLLGYQFRIAQLWGMFSPGPSKQSSWLELRARTTDDEDVCLRPDGRPCDGEPATPERLLSERWRKFHERVLQQQTPDLDARYAGFLLDRFERSPQGAPAIVSVVRVRRPSPSPLTSNPTQLPEERTVLATAGRVGGTSRDAAPRRNR